MCFGSAVFKDDLAIQAADTDRWYSCAQTIFCTTVFKEYSRLDEHIRQTTETLGFQPFTETEQQS